MDKSVVKQKCFRICSYQHLPPHLHTHMNRIWIKTNELMIVSYVKWMMVCVCCSQVVKRELDRASPCINVWNDTAQRLLLGIRSTDAQRARDQLTHITGRLRLQTRTCRDRLDQINSVLGDHPAAVRSVVGTVDTTFD